MSLRLLFGDFELDEARFELRRGGVAVAVQPKVLDLIFYLARHRARVVGKDELFEQVWRGVVVTEASLSQAVSLARRALGDTPEEQHTLRTVRGKGLQFVAQGQPSAPIPKQPARLGSTMLETAQEAPRRETEDVALPHLFVVLHCDYPNDGGASWSLGEVDEVVVVRGSVRRFERKPGMTRELRITVPGLAISRTHARIVRTPNEWLVVDEKSRNGTFVNGERIERRALESGDVIECGRTLFRFSLERSASDSEGGGLLTSVTPALLALEHDLARIASSDLPVLLLGESGAGKTHLAQALHRASGRRGPLVAVEASAVDRDAIERARNGTLLLESLERLPNATALTSALESAKDLRTVSTSIAPLAELEERFPRELLMRLAGYRCVLPPLRERIGDLGALVAAMLNEPPSIDVAAAHKLFRHDWPGNLRELAHVLKAARALAQERIGAEHVQLVKS